LEANCGFEFIDNEGEFYLRNCIEMTVIFVLTMKMMDFEERFLIGRMDLRAWNTKLKLT